MGIGFDESVKDEAISTILFAFDPPGCLGFLFEWVPIGQSYSAGLRRCQLTRRAHISDYDSVMVFDFGTTKASESFFDRHPRFYPTFGRLMSVANKCFGRLQQPKNRLEDICFGLGHTYREDYLEILMLASNGYGAGTTKLFRGLYERAVTSHTSSNTLTELSGSANSPPSKSIESWRQL